MTTKAELLEVTSVSRWLAELRMECYKKNLENFDTVQVSFVCAVSVCELQRERERGGERGREE